MKTTRRRWVKTVGVGAFGLGLEARSAPGNGILAAIAFCLLAASGVPATAQEEPIAGFEGLVEVTEVLLDVLAVDASGRTVVGLGEDDFLVEEDGEEVKVTGASFYVTRYGTGGELLTADGVKPSSRYFILFFHDQRQSATPQNRLLQQQLDAGRKAHNWVRDQLSGSDWVAVVSYDVKLVVHQDFTQDRGSLLAAIGDAAMAKDPGVRPPSERRRAGRAAATVRCRP